MDSRKPDRLRDRGVSSIQFLLASGLGMIMFLALANVVVVQYGRGALRSALDQGARVAAVTGSVAGCEARVGEVLDQLLGGTMGDGVIAGCEISGGLAIASGTAVFPSWSPLSPDFQISMNASAVLERPG